MEAVGSTDQAVAPASRPLSRWARSLPPRDAKAGSHTETFLVAAVATVLLVRGYLKLTGYPQVGGGGLHIAHLLWGGLLMLAGLIVLLSYLGQTPKQPATWLGGIGFGLFIDELGKFITEDNDYFYRPTIALIYVVFVALFLTLRAVQGRRPLSPTEHLANALALLDRASAAGLDAATRRDLLRHLAASDQRAPLVPALHEAVQRLPEAPASGPDPFADTRRFVGRTYRGLTGWRGFVPTIAAIFVVQAIALVTAAVTAIVADPGGVVRNLEDLSFVEAGALAASLVSGAFVVGGVVRLPTSRLAAFRWFDRALLVSILVGQFFAFAQSQFGALTGLVVTLPLLGAVRFVIHAEQETAA
jgi:hypothetical protein